MVILDFVNAEKQLRLFGKRATEELADRITVFRTKLQKRAGVVVTIDQQKVNTLQRLEKLLKLEAVQRESGETHFDAVARLYGWQTTDQLDRMLHTLESRKRG
jgi:hypothetical protein